MQFAGALWNHPPKTLEWLVAHRSGWSPVTGSEMKKIAAYLFYVKFVGPPGDRDRGKQLFEARQCSRCHQMGGRGGRVGPRLDDLGPYLSSFFLAQALWNHGPQMAARMAEMGVERPRLEGSDVADLVAFLRGDAGPAAPFELAYAQAGSPAAGKVLLEQKGCMRCHTVGGAGGKVGPNLDAGDPARRVGDLAAALWNHGPAMWAKMEELGVAFPSLTDREASDILNYLFFAQHTAAAGDAQKGSRLFREKSCAGCHEAGREGVQGPGLRGSAALRSPADWAAAMWNHLGVDLMAKTSRKPHFSGGEMNDLVAYLRAHAD
jgi:mono/diheme cytochrome c family protein